MSIVEFLLARIAEDKKRALNTRILPAEMMCPCGENGTLEYGMTANIVKAEVHHGIVSHILSDDDLKRSRETWKVPDAQVRILAECAAKRRIVEECAPNVAKDWPFPDGLNLSEFVVAELVQPYADHPDFDPAWR